MNVHIQTKRVSEKFKYCRVNRGCTDLRNDVRTIIIYTDSAAVDLTRWGSLMLAPIIVNSNPKCILHVHFTPHNVIAVMLHPAHCHKICNKYLVPDQIMYTCCFVPMFRKVVPVSVVVQKLLQQQVNN